jgi:acetoin utilization deacetylase AcuC-like enzyme
MAMYNFGELLEQTLLARGCPAWLSSQGKYDGYTPLHLAAMYDSSDCCQHLLAHGASVTAAAKVCGSTALHLAVSYGAKEVETLFLQHKDAALLASTHDSFGRSARELKSSDTNVSTNHKTGIFSSRFCKLHHSCLPSMLHTSQMPPENLWRIHVLIDKTDGVLFSSPLRSRLHYNLHAHSAALCDILQVHDWSYVRRVQSTCDVLNADTEDENGLAHLDGDTAVSRESYNAALGAAGAVCSAVDEVVNGKLQNAFCAVRPPGHHVGAKGATKSATGSDSHGFCLLNNVSIGAAYAMNKHRGQIQRVLIVDFDVHHGNGTEQTVKNLRPNVEKISINDPLGLFGSLCLPQYKPWRDEHDAENVLFVSVHGYGPPQRGLEHAFPAAAFYPGTGPTSLPDVKPKHDGIDEDDSHEEKNNKLLEKEAELVSMMVESESSEMKHKENHEDASDADSESDSDFMDGGSVEEEDEEVEVAEELFGNQLAHTLHMYDYSNPNSRAVSRAASPMILDIGVSLPQEPEASEDTIYSKLLADFHYRHTWRNYFREQIFPRIDMFQPDLIMISAGFDAHRRDTINAGYIALGEDDFIWVTERLVSLAKLHSQGRIVSVLEGGYSIGGEFASAFARSVAAHVETLTRAPTLPQYSQATLQAEKAAEIKYMDELRVAHEAELERKHREQQEFFERQKEIYEMRTRALGEQQQQQVPQQSIANAPVEEESHNSGRKRKRQAVDYAALEEKLRTEGNL